MWGNYSFDYACSLARGRSGGLISIWGPNLFVKENIWCDEAFIIVKGRWRNTVGDCYMINLYGPHDPLAKVALWNKVLNFLQSHSGKYILFGDMNEVRSEQERRGSIFPHNKADVFNSFINNTGFIDLPMGGHMFTWTNKAGSKLSKLDKFLISKEVVSLLPDIKITSLDRLWSDHSPILLHCTKCDFGPIPFKFYHSWFNRECINEVISSKFNNLANPTDGRKLIFHEKLQALKPKIKHWVATTKSNEDSHKQVLLKDLSVLDEKIDVGLAYSNNREMRIKLLQEADTLANFEAMDMIQKARIKWDVEGDENTKFFHCLINQKRRTQSINNIMQEGVWITNPIQIKEAFLNFLKDKFKANDSSITFPPARISSTLQPFDREYLESNITMDEVKNAVWECGSDKAPGPDGFTFAFVKSNPINIKDFRPISLIGIHYKIIAELLANRLSKVVGKVVNYEQSAFIKDRQILDGPLILSKVIDWYKKRKKKMMLFKVDFEKAFDTLNIHKSNIYGIVVSTDDVHLMASNTGCAAGTLPFTYLGLPIGGNMSLNENWKPVIDKFKAKLSDWKANLLSFGGRLTLIKSVLGSLGGLNMGSLKSFNLALLHKWRWRMFSNTNSLWVKVIKTLHGIKGGFDLNGCNNNDLWAKIVGSSNYLHSSNILPMDSIHFQVGCGLQTRFWKDIWLGSSPLCTRYSRLFRLEQDKDCLIKDRINNGQWTWNWSNNLGVRNYAYLNDLLVEISHLNVQADIDKCIWSLDNDGVFTVGALRRLIDNHFLPSLGSTTTWDKALPRKVNIEISLFEVLKFRRSLVLLVTVW
ncbi:RNA-directed DNA polymerase, eukaryota, reverse transcriptase zinc-binding domain protein [Tanacetum coccineum]|uniref:RNA-directed DNA polymerase, eukaryota, reverse transcriptase zinc-binding domain protein n=1 Tax=Tanacetum coccineum TaxID=301880 RepID=A0ABQ5FB96_9ASTR